MVNGFEVNISESDFKAKIQPEQNWILFQGVTSLHRCVSKIDTEGCNFAKKQNKHRSPINLITAVTTGLTIGLGIVYIIWQISAR